MAAVQKMTAQDLTASLSNAQMTKKVTADMDFGQVMKNNISTEQTKQTAPSEEAGGTQKTEPSKAETWKDKMEQAQGAVKVKQEEPVTEEDMIKAMENLITDVRNLIMDIFSVSEEELNAAMQELGIMDVELLDPKNLTDLTMKLTGNEDMMALLTDADLSAQLKGLLENVQEKKDEVFSKISMTEEEVIPLYEEALSEFVDISENRIEKIAGQQQNTDEKDAILSEKTADQEVDVVETVSTQQKEEKSSSDLTDQGQMPSMSQSIRSELNQAIEAVTDVVEPEQVMRQVVEKIKLTVDLDTTTFELQLEPAHLGKINLQVAAKDGVVTAQLATENQAVKEILESQIAILKENLENQGVKIEAVEVTIASHEFEQNLDNGKQEQQTGDESFGKKQRPFRFDMMEAEEEELTPEELIAKEMMLAGGNRINYMA